ncbi:MAG: hypothetical protein Q7J76_08490 [Candidatus Brocadiaceae bacterium]|uniref:hypothetical protein n=1 Tax=Candidatus Wunengus sp. YC61 TaxID=3367698 RepID=UPI002728AEA3|nr:hypothetical protein [Candidatus Brocadiaceae bacterium]
MAYRITDAATCSGCKHYGVCTNSKSGRMIVRLTREEVKEKLDVQEFQSLIIPL